MTTKFCDSIIDYDYKRLPGSVCETSYLVGREFESRHIFSVSTRSALNSKLIPKYGWHFLEEPFLFQQPFDFVLFYKVINHKKLGNYCI